MTPNEIIEAVGREYHITPDQLKSKKRTRPLPQIRHVLFAVIRERHPEMTITQIGQLLNCHHAMVIYGRRVASNTRDILIASIRERIASVIEPPVRMRFNDQNIVQP